jgi:hypothetical protein
MKGNTTAISWNPTKTILAFCSDEKDRDNRPGVLNLYGIRSLPTKSQSVPLKEKDYRSAPTKSSHKYRK